MKEKTIKFFDKLIYVTIILIPFTMAISPALMNICSGFLIFGFLANKLLKKKKIFIKAPLNLPFACFFIAAVISIFNSIDYKDSTHGLLRLIEYLFIYLIICEEVKDEKQIKRIVLSMVLGASLVSIDAFWQVIAGRDFIRGNLPVINIGIKRATASFPDANVLGIYLSAIAPLVVALALYYYKAAKKILMFLASLAIMAGVLLTYSRPTFLAIYICLVLLGIVKKDKFLIFFLLIITAIGPFVTPISVKDWAKEMGYNPLRFMCNDDRIAIYRNSLNMIMAHPVIGVGVNTFMGNYRKYKESPEYRNVVTSDYVYAHNNFLHMAGEVGILGLGIFFWLLYVLFKNAASSFRRLKGDFMRNVSLGLILCLAGFLLNGLTESSLYYSRVVIIFWYLVGLSLSLNKF